MFLIGCVIQTVAQNYIYGNLDQSTRDDWEIFKAFLLISWMSVKTIPGEEATAAEVLERSTLIGAGLVGHTGLFWLDLDCLKDSSNEQLTQPQICNTWLLVL